MINVLGIHTLDARCFQECEFLKIFEDIKLRTFSWSPPIKVYPSLVKTFFSNLYFTNVIIYSEVRKHKISMPLEGFTKTLNPPHDGSLFNPDEQGDNFNYKTLAPSFLINPICFSLPPIHCWHSAIKYHVVALYGKYHNLSKEKQL